METKALSEGGNIPYEANPDDFPHEYDEYDSSNDDSDEESDLYAYFQKLGLPYVHRIGDNFITNYNGKDAAVLLRDFHSSVPDVVRILTHLKHMKGVQRLYSWRYLSIGIHDPYKNAIIVSTHSGEEVEPDSAKYYCRRILRLVESLYKRGVIHFAIDDYTVVCEDGNVTLTAFENAVFMNEIEDSYVEQAKAEEMRMIGLLLATWFYPDDEIDTEHPTKVCEKSRNDKRVHLKDGFSLMRAMLRNDSSRRITIRKALDHRWFDAER